MMGDFVTICFLMVRLISTCKCALKFVLKIANELSPNSTPHGRCTGGAGSIRISEFLIFLAN